MIRMGRRVARAGALSLLLLGGFASSLYAARPSAHTGATTVTLATATPSTATVAATSTGATSAGTTTTAATTSGTTTTSTAPAVLAFSGHGWGHGLGLAQWGAYGYALHGWSYRRILAHYYHGTTLGTSGVTTVRVLVASEKRTTISSTVPFTVTGSGGAAAQLDPGKLVLTKALAVAGHPELRPPLAITAAAPLSVDGRAYRGSLAVSSDGTTVSTVDLVGLEAYLKGVVPAEMPSTWAPEALKAQAVAARSYALANRRAGRPFDLYGDTRDQAYGGIAAESAAADAAVDATRRTVVLYHGKVADTLFHSTSGGRTVSALEATGDAVPYLVSAADPYDTLSPYHDWGPVLVDASLAVKALKLSAPISSLDVAAGPSGRVQSVTIGGDDGSLVRVTGAQVRTALELRSTWFAPSLLELRSSARTITYGGAATLTGRALGAAGALTLEAKTVGADWGPVADLVPGADGTFSTIVKPRAKTSYRLAWGDVRAGAARVAVAARVTASLGTGGISGSSRPVVPAAAAVLQRRDGSTWTTLSSTLVDAAGGFSFGGTLAAGTYRVRVAPGHGLAAGLSAPLDVS